MDPGDPGGGGHVTPEYRRRIVEVLCEAYAADRLAMKELERRLDRAHRAGGGDELRALLTDLDLAGIDLSDAGLSKDAPSFPGEGFGDAGDGQGPSGVAGWTAHTGPARIRARQFTIAFWSARSRRGTWVPARRISAIAFQGGIELDFRAALLRPGVTEVRAVAFMGAVDIIVPPELHLETSGFAVLGAFEDEAGPSGLPGPEGPVLRLSAFALLGTVDVQVRLPGESERQARIRRRRENRLEP